MILNTHSIWRMTKVDPAKLIGERFLRAWLACMLLLPLTAQADPFTILAPSGLNLRSGPGLQYDKLMALPFGTVVDVLLDSYDRTYLEATFPPNGEVIEGQRGMWIKARHQGKVGYLFSGFGLLGDWIPDKPAVEGPVAMIMPYTCHGIDYPDLLQRKWYAVMCSAGDTWLEPTRLSIRTTNAADSSGFQYEGMGDETRKMVEVVPDCGGKWSCLIGVKGDRLPGRMNFDLRDGCATEEVGRFLEVGEEIAWQQGERNLRIRALMRPIPGKEQSGEYYHLEISYQGMGSSGTHLLCEEINAYTDLHTLRSYKVPRITLLGDFNGDGCADLLIEGAGGFDTCGQYYVAKVFLTSVEGNRVRLRMAGELESNDPR